MGHQTQQQIEDILQQNKQQMQRLQELVDQDLINRQTPIHFRVQVLLNAQSRNLKTPRLFIVLPHGTGPVDGNGSPPSLQFRLYFLCECDSHTTQQDMVTTHVVHMSKDEGYDLERPTEFFDKYGSYVLAMMHMVKYGTMAAGLVVPSLAQSKLVATLNVESGHLGFVKNNISRLVDDTTQI
ncbi:hypothetical protein BGZ65_011770 [Modicella reniformis]|uniref:Uncharacterized protein n=1 Tax=Modicella reniformis TaxID=1440133 RepID=A0A9P6MLF9_9FUNG|nr:hypothetical protein BGZ65_011770 [Modicella reniformis]